MPEFPNSVSSTNEVLWAALAAVFAAVLGALITVINQNRLAKNEIVRLRLEEVATSKKKVIEDLVAYRFVLTDNGNHPEPTMRFNAALSKVPILFGSNDKCVRLYNALENNFTSSKFHDLVIALMEDVPLETKFVSAEALARVQKVTPQ